MQTGWEWWGTEQWVVIAQTGVVSLKQPLTALQSEQEWLLYTGNGSLGMSWGKWAPWGEAVICGCHVVQKSQHVLNCSLVWYLRRPIWITPPVFSIDCIQNRLHSGTDDEEIRCTQPLPVRCTQSSDHCAAAGWWVLPWSVSTCRSQFHQRQEGRATAAQSRFSVWSGQKSPRL